MAHVVGSFHLPLLLSEIRRQFSTADFSPLNDPATAARLACAHREVEFSRIGAVMSDLTEIYICKPGQELKQGKLEHSNISTKEEAEKDAKSRCKYDSSIGRIAYYAVDASGGFRNFFTYENPNAVARKPRPASGGSATRPAGAPVRRPARAPSLLQRIRAAFEED